MNEELNSIVKQLNKLALKQTGLNPKEKTIAKALKHFVDSYGGVTPGSSMWGTISGSIENQTDLINKINAMINNELANFEHLDYEIVDVLPTIGEAGKRYLIKDTTDNRYEEYIYINNQWNDIGSSDDVNLNNYYNKTEVDALLTGKADVSALPTKTSDLTNDSLFVDKDTDQLTNYTKTTALNNALNLKADKSTTYTKDEVNDKLDLKADTDDIPTKTSDLTNDSGFITKAVNNLENYTKTTDLNTALGLKANSADIPTKTSDLTNDSGYIDVNVNNLTNYTKTTDLNDALNLKANRSTVYTKTEINTKLDDYYTKTEINNLEGKALYNVAAGTLTGLTLSETAANFDYLEIYYMDLDKNTYSSTKVYSPNGKTISLTINKFTDKGYILNKRISISGTAVTVESNKKVVIEPTLYPAGQITYSNDNEIYIYRVTGYKKIS